MGLFDIDVNECDVCLENDYHYHNFVIEQAMWQPIGRIILISSHIKRHEKGYVLWLIAEKDGVDVGCVRMN